MQELTAEKAELVEIARAFKKKLEAAEGVHSPPGLPQEAVEQELLQQRRLSEEVQGKNMSLQVRQRKLGAAFAALCKRPCSLKRPC